MQAGGNEDDGAAAAGPAECFAVRGIPTADLQVADDVVLPPLQPRQGGEYVEGNVLERDTAWRPPPKPEGDVYEVSRVVAKERRGRHLFVRVRWVGWSDKDDTWELAEGFAAEDKLREFEADEELLRLWREMSRLREYLIKGRQFASGHRVSKSHRGLARAQLLGCLRELETKICGDAPESEHFRNVLGSSVYAAAIHVPHVVGRCLREFGKVGVPGQRLLDAEGRLIDVPYGELLGPLRRISEAIFRAVEEEQQANEEALLEVLRQEASDAEA